MAGCRRLRWKWKLSLTTAIPFYIHSLVIRTNKTTLNERRKFKFWTFAFATWRFIRFCQFPFKLHVDQYVPWTWPSEPNFSIFQMGTNGITFTYAMCVHASCRQLPVCLRDWIFTYFFLLSNQICHSEFEFNFRTICWRPVNNTPLPRRLQSLYELSWTWTLVICVFDVQNEK